MKLKGRGRVITQRLRDTIKGDHDGGIDSKCPFWVDYTKKTVLQHKRRIYGSPTNSCLLLMSDAPR